MSQSTASYLASGGKERICIMTIPMVVAYVAASVLGGAAVTRIGYYTPFLITSSILMAVGAGLISSLSVKSGPAQWIGFQVVYGIGLGLGADLPFVAAQTVLAHSSFTAGYSITSLMSNSERCCLYICLSEHFRQQARGPLGPHTTSNQQRDYC